MSDGTALNLGDPNSMRDQGQTRNAVYNGHIRFNQSKSLNRLPYRQFLRRDGPSNNTFYSFGGSKAIRDETEQNHLLNPIFRDYDGKVVQRDVIVYRKDMNQRVQDYTKNISQSIFSPGELIREKQFLSNQYKLNALRDKMRANRKQPSDNNPYPHASPDAKLMRATGNSMGRRTNSAQPVMRAKLDRFK